VSSRYGSLALLLLIVIAASAIAGAFTGGEWYYVKLVKPSWTAPAWLFGFLGAIASVSLAVSAWTVWLTGHADRRAALGWWLLLLALGVSWSALFFGLNRPGWSWALLSVSLGVAGWTFVLFRRVSEQAAWLLGPWLAWAVYLWSFNLSSWSLSGGILGRLLA
jgi:benzodiazapine receptor